jgi:hypothetical protein
MQIAKNAVPPRRIISLLQIETDGHDVYAAHQRFADERFQPQHLISCAALLADATLDFSQCVVAFNKPDKSLVDRTDSWSALSAGSYWGRSRLCPSLVLELLWLHSSS